MISKSLIILLIIFSIVLLIITTSVLKKGRIPIKYSLVWYFSAIILLIVALVPQFLELVASLFGFETISNLIIGVLISLLLFITMSLTIIVSGQKKKITLLIQEVSMLKSAIKNDIK